ncbi:MAG: glycosyltransferase family 4 protein [Candidatus Omnitrophota bacterium]|nr:glycosyltransferase family 4 protein [Candidatus Omnitrophota bacterium]
MRVLFLVPYPTEGPSNRYRVEQYLPYLTAANIDFTLRPFMSSKFYSIFYKKGKWLLKTIYFFQSSFNRFLDIFRALRHDVVFIHIEAFPLGPPFIEWFFFKLKKPIIFDFEDAIYLPRKGISNFFKNPSKFFKIVTMSRHVIVCNNYMKVFLEPYNKNITVIPTSIDIDKFMPRASGAGNKDVVTIGWIGSHTTLPFLLALKDVFKKIYVRHKFTLKIVGGGTKVTIDGINVMNEEWSLDKEVENFQSIDIGVYPILNDEWAKAKTPFKTIQYMSVGVPCVVSDVGANRDIIKDGVNGYLVRREEEWIDKISKLMEDSNLRKNIGLEGRKTVEDKFSLKVNSSNFLEIIKKVGA